MSDNITLQVATNKTFNLYANCAVKLIFNS